MKRTKRIYQLLIAAAVAVGCSHEPTSKYPGQLGAPCTVDSDCKNGMLCSTTHLLPDPIPFCFSACTNADSECPEGSLCDDSVIPDVNGGSLRVCYRRCDNLDFCSDLNPEFNACQTFGLSQTICGFRG